MDPIKPPAQAHHPKHLAARWCGLAGSVLLLVSVEAQVVFWGNNCCGQGDLPGGAADVVALAGGDVFCLGLRRSDAFLQQPDVDVVVDRSLDGIAQAQPELRDIRLRLLRNGDSTSHMPDRKDEQKRSGKPSDHDRTLPCLLEKHHRHSPRLEYRTKCKEGAASERALWGPFR